MSETKIKKSNGSSSKKHSLNLTSNAITVLEARYLRKDPDGNPIETPEDLFHRVASNVAEVEGLYSEDAGAITRATTDFYNIMAEGYFMPNSPTLMNAGREMGMLSACFVLPLEDSIDGIFSTVKATAMIQKAGGGTGFSFDKLRPTGDYIKSSGGTTSGPISFWKVLSETTNAIQQGAFRRGANMGMMSITHPDILKFVKAKQDLTAFTNFNISIKISNQWMEAFNKDVNSPHVVENHRSGVKYVLKRDLDVAAYDLASLTSYEEFLAMSEDDRPKVWTRKELFDLIVDCAWKTGEPGLIFIDNINKANPTPHIGAIEATNPCGEQPLLPYEACNLGSINVAKFVQITPAGVSFDWDSLKKVIHTSTRFLDNVIDANKYPLPEIEAMCKGNRKIGLGIMGFADALFLQDIAYNSEEGLAFGEQVMKFINDESHNASEALADERGCFSNWKGSIWDTDFNRKMRNSATTTVAPTGTISIIANCSGGIEPLFSLAFFRHVLNGKKLAEVNPIFEKAAREAEVYSPELIEKIAQEGTLAHLESIPEDLKRVFVCSHDIAPIWHVRMQGAFQKHCDSSISKTINLPHTASREEVSDIYRLAWELDCKGVTVYRDGCRHFQPMALDNVKKDEELKAAAPVKRSPKDWVPRRPMRTPTILSAVRLRQNTPFGHMHVTISLDPKFDREMEIFAQLGKAGDVAMSDLEAISRLTSLYLRLGGSVTQIIDQLEGIGSHMSIATRDGKVMSLADGLGKILRRYQEAKNQFGIKAILTGEVDFDKLPSLRESAQSAVATSAVNSPKDTMMDAFKVKCPECQGTLSFSEGCVKCYSCGYSQC
jgi:ribonucleoside-diphosphate reductase alpha chain